MYLDKKLPVVFYCPSKLSDAVDALLCQNMMDRTSFIIAAIARFCDYHEDDNILSSLPMEEFGELYESLDLSLLLEADLGGESGTETSEPFQLDVAALKEEIREQQRGSTR